MSRFKAAHTASSYNMSTPTASTSLGASVLPASSSKVLRRAIRTGRLEGDKLVGGEDSESASEPEDENAKELLELLKKGEVHNVGPAMNAVAPPSTLGLPFSSLSTSHTGSATLSSTSTSVQIPADPVTPRSQPKVSKFKLNRAYNQAPRATPGPASPDSVPNTPISHVSRSSPKLPTISTGEGEYGQSSTVTSISPSTQFSAIAESPSFPRPTFSASPSHPSLQQSIEPATSGRRLDRPPTVMSAAVLESTRGDSDVNTRLGQVKEKKVSRFLAERMQ